MKKRCISMLLALLLCLQLLPTAVFAATTYSIEVEQTVDGGTATITAPEGDDITKENGKVSGLTTASQFVTVTAAPKDGKRFSGWSISRWMSNKWVPVTAATMIANISTMGTDENGDKCTLKSNPLKIAISSKTGMNKTNLKLTPVFLTPVQVTAVSADAKKGTLTPNTISAVPGGEAVTLTAAPAEGCTFTGCTLAYTESKETVPSTDYTLKIDGNTVTLTLGAKVTSAVTVTGHFVDAKEPNFIVPGKDLKVVSGGSTATVTGWNNNPDDKVTVTLNAVNTTEGIKFFLKDYEADKTYSQRVPTNVTFDFSKTASINKTDNGEITFSLKGDGLSTLLEIPFTVTDGTDRGHTKDGVIRLEFANRALVSSGKGTVKYNGKEYKDGEWIDFTADADGKATIEAVGYDEVTTFGMSTLMQLSSWAIKNVELSDDDSKTNPLTFTLPNKYFEITPSFDTKAKTISIQTAEGGSASFADDKTAVVQVMNGTEFATATATPSNGYAFSKWNLAHEKPNAKDKENPLWVNVVIDTTAGSTQYRVGAGNTQYSNPLQIGVASQNLRLTPVFVNKVALTVASSDAERGSVTASAAELPVGGDGVTLTVAAAEGCTFENWTVTYTETGSAVPASAYTLTKNQDGTWKLVNNSIGQAMTVTANFYSDKDANFVVEGKLPAFVSSEDESSSTATVSGWTNDTTEKIVVTFNQIYSDSRIYLKKDNAEFVPANVTIDIQNPSGTTITKTTTDTDVYYDLGNISGRTEIPFTAADGRGNTKTGVIRLEVANHAQVSITSGKESGTITHNGKTYSDGDMLIFTPTDGKVTVKAVPAKGYRFAGWVIDGATLTDASAAEITFDAPMQFVTLKATFEKYAVRFKYILDSEDKTSGSTPYAICTFTDDMDIDTAIKNWGNSQVLQKHDAKLSVQIPAGTSVLIRISDYTQSGTYLYSGLSVLPAINMQERAVYNSAQYLLSAHYYLFTMPENDVNITVAGKTAANFEIKANSEQQSSGTVEFTPAAETGIYREGTPLMMVAVPAEGYTFKEWREVGGTHLSSTQKTAATVQFVVSSSSTFTAVFEQTTENKPLPIILKTEPETKAKILVNGSESTTAAAYGSKLAVSLCDLDEYYLFDHWEITQNTTGESGLIREVDKSNTAISFVMPNDRKGVTIKAVLKERTIPVSFKWTVDGAWSNTWSERMTFAASVNGKAVPGSIVVKKGDELDVTVKIVKEYEDQFVLNKLRFEIPQGGTSQLLKECTDIHGVYTVSDWLSGIQVWADLTKKTEATTRYAITLTQPTTGGTIQSSNQTAMAGTEVTLTAAPAAGYALKAWTVTSGGNAITVTAKQDDANQATFTMPAADVAVTAEFKKVEIVAPEITAVQLLDSTTKALIAPGDLIQATDTWVITLPANVEQSVLDNLTMQYLKITHTGVSAAMKGGTDDTVTDYKWANGDIMCGMRLDEEATFTITAADKTTKKVYKIKIVKAEPTEDGAYTIKYSGPKGGTIIPSKVKANAGETITLTIKPDSGKQMKAGTLTYTIAVTNGETVSITGTSFVMPENNVTLSCMWEDAKTSGDDTTVSGITAFSIDGVAGVVDNTDNTISVIMPYKTDVTKLIPTIAGNNIRSISPASGKMVNFSRPVTYTVTLTDGTVKQYTVTVYVQAGSKADQMWDKLTDFYDQTPWWDYADHQTSTGSYPKYW